MLLGQPGDRVLRVGEEHHGVIGDGNVLQFHPRRLRLGLQLLRGQGGGEEGVHLPVDEPLVGLMALGVALRELRMVVIIPEERPVYSPGVGVGGGGAVDDGHSFVKAPVDGGLGGVPGQAGTGVVQEGDRLAPGGGPVPLCQLLHSGLPVDRVGLSGGPLGEDAQTLLVKGQIGR